MHSTGPGELGNPGPPVVRGCQGQGPGLAACLPLASPSPRTNRGERGPRGPVINTVTRGMPESSTTVLHHGPPPRSSTTAPRQVCKVEANLRAVDRYTSMLTRLSNSRRMHNNIVVSCHSGKCLTYDNTSMALLHHLMGVVTHKGHMSPITHEDGGPS